MTCKNCGNVLNPRDQFCENCGNPAQSSKTSRSSLNLILSIILVILLLITAIVTCLLLIPPDPNPDPDPTPTESNLPTQTVEVATSTMYVVDCNEWISLRTQPSKSATRITTIPLGASVGFISSASNGFYKISYNGQVGYALASYLSSTKPQPTQATTTERYMTVVNCNEWISLRTQPSKSATRIATIPLGASVRFISNASNDFYKISYNGQVGYALASYLR